MKLSRFFPLDLASTRSAWTRLLLVSFCLGVLDPAEAVGGVHPSLPNYYPILGGFGQKAPGGSSQPGIRIHIIDESMEGQVVPAKPGDLIEVHLKMASGTSYMWSSGAIDGRSVARNGPPRTEVAPGMDIGRPATVVVPFRVVANGSTILRFDLKSFVDPSQPPARGFTVTIRGIPNRMLRGKK